MMVPGRRDPEQTTQDAKFPFHPTTIPQVPMMLLHFMDRFAQFFFLKTELLGLVARRGGKKEDSICGRNNPIKVLLVGYFKKLF